MSKRFFFSLLMALPIMMFAMSTPEKYEYGVYYYQRASLFDALPVDSTDIIMLGDSQTNGCEWHELLGKANVKNRGISSDVMQGVCDRMQPLVEGQPAKIFLLIGVNDVSHDLGVDSIVDSYAHLVDMMRETMPNTQLYVQSMLPINISYGMYKGMTGRDQEIRDINARLKPIVEAKGCTWIDLCSALSDDEGHLKAEYTNDGLHLMGPAYLRWRDVILPYID